MIKLGFFIITNYFTGLSLFFELSSGHHGWSYVKEKGKFQHFSMQYGVMVSFERPVYINGLFQEFDQWKSFNERHGSSNITYSIPNLIH